MTKLLTVEANRAHSRPSCQPPCNLRAGGSPGRVCDRSVSGVLHSPLKLTLSNGIPLLFPSRCLFQLRRVSRAGSTVVWPAALVQPRLGVSGHDECASTHLFSLFWAFLLRPIAAVTARSDAKLQIRIPRAQIFLVPRNFLRRRRYYALHLRLAPLPLC